MEATILRTEGSAILADLMRRAKAIIANEMALPPVPPLIARETARWLATQDTFQAWFGAECVACGLDDHAPLRIEDLERRYRQHVERMGGATTDDMGMPTDEAMGPVAFLAGLRRNGAILEGDDGKGMKDTQGKRVVAGMRLKIAIVADEPVADSA
jgi:hypothetical protein